jgi:nickel-dependent lactate racemase
MLIDFPYGGEIVNMEFPDHTDVLSGRMQNVLSDDEVREAIEKEFAIRKNQFENRKISIIINDITRRVPTEKILGILLNYIPLQNVEILVATGTHKKPTPEDLERIMGAWYGKLRSKIHCHDCDNQDLLRKIGETSWGTPVEINGKFLEAEAVICINSVEPHFFAGFTGGRKSIVPGLAGRDTVVANHSLAKSEKAKSLHLEDNPVHLDLMEAVDMVVRKPVFSIQMVLSRNGEIIDLFCGEMAESFLKACEVARDIYSIPISNRYDIVFAIGEHPLDVNLYQLQKAQEHGAEAVSDGGILIVVGACDEGVGSPYFMNLADDYPSPESALSEKAMNDNRFGIHKLVKTARRLEKIKIWYVTKLDDKVVAKVYFVPICSPQVALNEALEYFGGVAKIAILRDACFLVPVRTDVKGGL